jgi:hypothetical protein
LGCTHTNACRGSANCSAISSSSLVGTTRPPSSDQSHRLFHWGQV